LSFIQLASPQDRLTAAPAGGFEAKKRRDGAASRKKAEPERGVKLCTAAHSAVGLAGESPVVGIDCLFMRPEEVVRWLREGKSMARPAWKRASGSGLAPSYSPALDCKHPRCAAEMRQFLFAVLGEQCCRSQSPASVTETQSLKDQSPVYSVAQMPYVRIEPCVLFSQDLRPRTHGLRGRPPFADPRGPQWSAVQTTLWAP
jgi:hypothetical protein